MQVVIAHKTFSCKLRPRALVSQIRSDLRFDIVVQNIAFATDSEVQRVPDSPEKGATAHQALDIRRREILAPEFIDLRRFGLGLERPLENLHFAQAPGAFLDIWIQ